MHMATRKQAVIKTLTTGTIPLITRTSGRQITEVSSNFVIISCNHLAMCIHFPPLYLHANILLQNQYESWQKKCF